MVLTNRKLRDKVKADFLQIALKYAAHQSSQNSLQKVLDHTETLKTMTSAVEKMAIAIGSKPSSLERWTVPSWDGSRRTYQSDVGNGSLDTVWPNMDKTKMSNFKDMKSNVFWTDQVKTCKDIDQAWEILENELANE